MRRLVFWVFCLALLALAGCKSRQRIISKQTIYPASTQGDTRFRTTTGTFSPHVRMPETRE
ncbi:MAG: hypothetical protein FWF96_03530 [Kiritimatiellaeota bacterium]|nr:hypothetical protein [Kiritimatiellota bacterium]